MTASGRAPIRPHLPYPHNYPKPPPKRASSGSPFLWIVLGIFALGSLIGAITGSDDSDSGSSYTPSTSPSVGAPVVPATSDSSYWRSTGYDFADGVIEVDGERDGGRIQSDCGLKASLLDLDSAETLALKQGCIDRIAEGVVPN